MRRKVLGFYTGKIKLIVMLRWVKGDRKLRRVPLLVYAYDVFTMH